MDILVQAAGSPLAIGRAHGRQARHAVQQNVEIFWQTAIARGCSRQVLRDAALADEAHWPLARLEEVAGIAQGADLPYDEVLTYNTWHPVLFPDECSVGIAHGQTGKGGHTYFWKNSDKVGGSELQGPGFAHGKEINAFFYVRPNGLPTYMGVGAAGTTGLKFGCSDRGIAVGANIARTTELRSKNASLSTIRAADRAELARLALEEGTARAAALRISAIISESPMGTPGNMEFVDESGVWLLEGSYDRQCLTWCQDTIVVRTNRFELFHEFNDPEDISSHCRYVRAFHLLDAKRGAVDRDTMIRASMDHGNGPGKNSLCRHSPDMTDETSLSSGVVEIIPGHPEATVFDFSLGKPCVAWPSAAGHYRLSFQVDAEAVPAMFYDGTAWLHHYRESPEKTER